MSASTDRRPRATGDKTGELVRPELPTEYLQREAAQGRRQDFDRFLRAAPDMPDIADEK